VTSAPEAVRPDLGKGSAAAADPAARGAAWESAVGSLWLVWPCGKASCTDRQPHYDGLPASVGYELLALGLRAEDCDAIGWSSVRSLVEARALRRAAMLAASEAGGRRRASALRQRRAGAPPIGSLSLVGYGKGSRWPVVRFRDSIGGGWACNGRAPSAEWRRRADWGWVWDRAARRGPHGRGAARGERPRRRGGGAGLAAPSRACGGAPRDLRGRA
jgi:hypothetical protein